jgi:hypothetical protein
MSVGIPVDKATLDRTIGNCIIGLHNQFATIEKIQAYLAARDTPTLMGMGYTEDDVTLVKSAFSQLTALIAIAEGQGTQAEENNFFFFADQLTGLQ